MCGYSVLVRVPSYSMFFLGEGFVVKHSSWQLHYTSYTKYILVIYIAPTIALVI